MARITATVLDFVLPGVLSSPNLDVIRASIIGQTHGKRNLTVNYSVF
jgi:hypothetical protein